MPLLFILSRLGSALALKKKGLRLGERLGVPARSLFSTGPEEKGIETFLGAFSRPFLRSALALKKKGLRRYLPIKKLARCPFSTGPEEKGIETCAALAYSSLS